MKTFETEKNNIPEGATHYSEEDKRNLFTWFKVGDTVEFFSELTGKWQLVGAHINCLKARITPIPKPEVVEWKNGDECVIRGEKVIYIGESIEAGIHCVQEFGTRIYRNAHLSVIEKPESPEEKEQRERLESAYDLYTHVQSVRGQLSCKFDWFSNSEMEETRLRFLAIVDKTNYRKGE